MTYEQGQQVLVRGTVVETDSDDDDQEYLLIKIPGVYFNASVAAADVVGPAPATHEWVPNQAGTHPCEECGQPREQHVGPAPATPGTDAPDYTPTQLLSTRPDVATPLGELIEFEEIEDGPATATPDAYDALAAAEAELAAFRAECDKVGIPYDAEGLVRHHRGNAGAAGAAQGMAEYARRLTAAEAQRDAWRELAEARNELLACYRVGQRPPERLMGRIFAARQAVADLSVEATGTEGGGND